MVTSFKGNQKLIFEGFRYNIHHIVPAKGVKTWRCVCAKKLTSARSWCKGRAETWDDDTQGISKGEHNHTAEHETAELEYFKSQLILAAIASPSAPLHQLIEEAAKHMSPGLKFGSTESLKKSLTVARKSAENGGFKLKPYKNSTCGEVAPKAPKTTAADSFANDLKLFEVNGTMASLLSLVGGREQLRGEQEGSEDGHSNPSNDQSTASTTSSLLNSFNAFNGTLGSVTSDYIDIDADTSPLVKAMRFDASASSAYESATSPFNDSPTNGNGHDLSGVNSPSARSTPLSTNGGGLSTQVLQQKKNAIDKAIRTARVNDIFNKLVNVRKLSYKVQNKNAQNTADSPTSDVKPQMCFPNGSPVNGQFPTRTASTLEAHNVGRASSSGAPHLFENGGEISLGACLAPTASGCGCRIIRVCCCSEDTCQKRYGVAPKRTYSKMTNGGA
jgi:hypothetical protein